MAVVAVNLLYTGRSGRGDINAHRSYRETYEILCDLTTVDDVVSVSNAPGLPVRGTPKARDPVAIVTEVEITQDEENPLRWHADVTYDSNPDFKYPDPTSLPDNPLLRPAVWRYSFGKSSEVVRRWYVVNPRTGALAANPTAVLNSALLPYDPPLMAEVSRPILRVTKNLASVTTQLMASLQDAVNSTAWLGFAPRQVRIDSVEANSKFESGLAFVELSVDFMMKAETWDARPLDCGFAELTSRTNEFPPPARINTWTKIRDNYAQYITEPVPLNGQGKKLAPGDDPVFLRGLPTNYQLLDFNTVFSWGQPVVFGG